jgi:AsmA-like C-terminal region
MKKKAAWWAAIGLAAVVAVLGIVAAVGTRTERLRKLVIATLEERLESNVELDAFSVRAFPTVIMEGEGLVIRLRGPGGDPNPSTPPLIQIKRFTVHSGIVDLIRRPRRFDHVVLEGLVVNIPPGGIRQEWNRGGEAGKPSDEAGDRASGERWQRSPIIVDELRADNALLRIIPRREGKAPREFAIHALTMRSLGLREQMPFKATLTNPVPKGMIETSGTFGPWRKDDPSSTPLAGSYTLAKADLGTIKGIGGILDSTGEFGGKLERIEVRGVTNTPDFSLDISAQPVPLTTKFNAVVDGTNGDTYLEAVDAQFLRTSLTAKGSVERPPGGKGRTIKLHVRIHEGRVEDLLRLSTKARTPLMVGHVALHTDFTLPPGDADVIVRLRLAGEFDVGSAQFTNPKVRDKLVGMSHRARGLDSKDQKADNVVSNLTGRFRVADGRITFTQLSFSIPGAAVVLHGTYGLRSEELAFDGVLRMDATISEAAGGGGLKRFFLKIIDPIFRKQGAGAVVPIRIRGTVDNPRFGLDVGRVFKSK